MINSTQIKSFEIKFIVIALVTVNFLLELVPLWRGSFILDYFSTPADFSKTIEPIISIYNFGLMSLGLIIHLIHYPRFNQSNFIIFVILFSFYFISIALNSFKSGFFSVVFTPVGYLFVFFAIEKYSLPSFFEKYFRIGLLFWGVIPVLLVLFTNYSYNEYFFSLPRYPPITFGGLAAHQNGYGYYAGIGVLLVIFGLHFNKWTLVLLPFLFIGINMSESRSALIATVFCLLYFFLNKGSFENKYLNINTTTIYKKNSRAFGIILILLIIIVFVGIIYYWLNFGSRKNSIMEAGYRAIIYKTFWEFISEHFLFGNGGGYMAVTFRSPQGTPAHNFLVQSMADYGVFVTILFLLFIIFLWKEFKLHGRCLLLYMLIFGLFQPYFNGFGILSGSTLVTFLLGIYYDNIMYNGQMRV